MREKLAIFAVRLDTFVAENKTAVFYIGTNQTETLNDLRRHMLANFKQLPISGEYIHVMRLMWRLSMAKIRFG